MITKERKPQESSSAKN